jgi:hypothetical protein
MFVDVEQKLDFGILEQEIIQLTVFLVELLRDLQFLDSVNHISVLLLEKRHMVQKIPILSEPIASPVESQILTNLQQLHWSTFLHLDLLQHLITLIDHAYFCQNH